MRVLIMLTFLLQLTSCTEKNHDQDVSHQQVVQVVQQDSAILIPNVFWEIITGENLKDSSISLKNHSFFLDEYQISLKNKTDGVVNDNWQKLSFKKSGSVLDLQNYLTGKSGSFYFEFDTETSEEEEIKIFFYTIYKSKKIDNEIWGQDCFKLYDLTNYLVKKKSLLTNTTNNRHAHLLSGTYLISKKRKNNFFISAFEVKDSRVPLTVCEAKKE